MDDTMSAIGTMSVGISPAINRRSLLIGAASAAAVVPDHQVSGLMTVIRVA